MFQLTPGKYESLRSQTVESRLTSYSQTDYEREHECFTWASSFFRHSTPVRLGPSVLRHFHSSDLHLFLHAPSSSLHASRHADRCQPALVPEPVHPHQDRHQKIDPATPRDLFYRKVNEKISDTIPTLIGMLQPVSSSWVINCSRGFNRKGSRNCQARRFSKRISAEIAINPSA